MNISRFLKTHHYWVIWCDHHIKMFNGETDSRFIQEAGSAHLWLVSLRFKKLVCAMVSSSKVGNHGHFVFSTILCRPSPGRCFLLPSAFISERAPVEIYEASIIYGWRFQRPCPAPDFHSGAGLMPACYRSLLASNGPALTQHYADYTTRLSFPEPNSSWTY